MKAFYFLYNFIALLLILSGVISSCDYSPEILRTEPTLEIDASVTATPVEDRRVVKLLSSYPWYAEASEAWIHLTRNRGQALKQDSLIFTCDANPEMDDREGWIEIRLMDQLKKRLKVVQQGRGSLITLGQSLIIFNRQGGDALIEVLTRLDWKPETSSKEGFTFTRVDDSHLKVTAPLNTSGVDRATEIKLVDKENTTSATLSILQKAEDKILFIPKTPAEKDIVLKKGSFTSEIPLTVNVDYETEASDPWISVLSAPKISGTQVQNVNLSFKIEPNGSGEEREGFLVVKNAGKTEASDTIFITQRAKSKIIYVKPGASGDGTTWDLAFGSIEKAMAATDSGGDMEVWVASGEYQLTAPLVWKYVNVYGGFKGNESKLSQRDLTNKPVIKGGEFHMLKGYRGAFPFSWMDGMIFADAHPKDDSFCFEIYDNHGFRNCEFVNIRQKNQPTYFEKCVFVNCIFREIYSNRHLVRSGGSQFYNCAFVNMHSANSGNPNSNGIYCAMGTQFYNCVVWNVTTLDKGGKKIPHALSNGGKDTKVFNCAFPKGSDLYNSVASQCIWIDGDNDAAQGPHFVNPTGDKPDFSLKSGSPLIDAGLKIEQAPGFKVPVLPKIDFLGGRRVQGNAIDMAPIEYAK